MEKEELIKKIQNSTTEEIRQMIINGEVEAANLTDAGICPTCFSKANDNIVYGDNTGRMIYEDEDFECFLESKPRAVGHTIILAKTHYKDMMEADPEIINKIFPLSHKTMKALMEVYPEVESVYLCTMCDGQANHFHVQLIPRYSGTKRGSENFVRPRQDYVEDKEKLKSLRKILNDNQ